MPKMKTRKCIAKRIKRTASGKFMYSKPGRRHLMSSKTSKRKRHMRKAAMLPAAHAQRIKKALPYGA